jgi:hypothetical protein
MPCLAWLRLFSTTKNKKGCASTDSAEWNHAFDTMKKRIPFIRRYHLPEADKEDLEEIIEEDLDEILGFRKPRKNI